MRPFNLEEAKKGAKVCTRDGRNVRIICFDAKRGHFPIIALIENGDRERVASYCANGRYNYDKDLPEHCTDLFMAPEKHEGWVNIVDDGHGNHVGTCIWKTREEAEKHKPLYCVSTVKIEWEE